MGWVRPHHLLSVLLERVQDDHALLYPVHVKVIDLLHFLIEQRGEGGTRLRG